MKDYIAQQVHKRYWDDDINCARTALTCLADCFSVTIQDQTLSSAIGLHGAGGFRAQCGLVEGALMFMGIYFHLNGKSDSEIADICYEYAELFIGKFGSLRCYDLRPNGFSENDPPHACEELTVNAIFFSYEFVRSIG